MTTAIFEILSLLIISCAIGVIFTYRYWKSKYLTLEDELATTRQEKSELEKQAQELKNDNQKLATEVIELKAELEKASKSNSKAKPQDNSKKLKDEIKELKDQIELHEQSIDEKEREIEELSKELAAKKIPYYKQIDGKRYKAITLMKADESVAGKGDGRISKEDAEMIFATISDGKAYTQVEKDTMYYLRHNYNWTEGADALFRKKVRSWAAKGHELT